MASVVDICNLALSRLGEKSISSIDEAGAAEKCKIEFNPTKEAILRDYDWSFARRIEALAPVDGETFFGWDYVYVYPKSCEAIRKIFNEATYNSDELPPYEVVSSNVSSKKLILCNLDSAYIRYTANITDTTIFDASFVDAFSWKLGANLAKPLTGNASLSTDLMNTYLRVIDKASVNNASEGYQTQKQTSSLLKARG
ncbi:MAG TPA: hypothetical protein DDW50_20985 [Firmicutes bacterium]|jgi:hypothetical protein|nr:hypothetical protein [Bacillota bacterium]